MWSIPFLTILPSTIISKNPHPDLPQSYLTIIFLQWTTTQARVSPAPHRYLNDTMDLDTVEPVRMRENTSMPANTSTDSTSTSGTTDGTTSGTTTGTTNATSSNQTENETSGALHLVTQSIALGALALTASAY